MATVDNLVSMKELPVGFRFNPSNEDLVHHYLKRKLQNVHEDCCLIPEFDIYKLPPWDLITKFNDLSDLPSDGRECYFFYRRTHPNGKRNCRKTKEGYWHLTGPGRKPRDTDQIKWHKRILDFRSHTQKSHLKTDWVMHEWEDISDTRIVVCRISKKRSKGKVKDDSVSSEACPIQSLGSTAGSEIHIKPQETSPEASEITIMESQNLTPNSNINLSEFNISSHQQKNTAAEDILYFSKNAYTDTTKLVDLQYFQDPLIARREQSPCSDNASITGFDQGGNSWPTSGNFTLGECVSMSMYCQMPTDQWLNSISPPQQSCILPTEEIAPIGNTSFNCSGSSSGMTCHQLDVQGHGVHLPFHSIKYGAQETNLEESPLSQNPIQMTEQSPHFETMSIHGVDQEDCNWFCHGDVSLEEGDNASMFGQTSNDQSLNYAFPLSSHMMIEDSFEDINLLLYSFIASLQCASEDTLKNCI
ncbi:hypothetical protein SAY86_022828 [Trapa natans]|uniref:NAC domain-containing protein n=1 Tax=Trapa natans TaxID=22666 RepID=A0AAN7RB01_TRANT|nr:hypothetical protein SAY86_022828 [Trapa natans]